MHPLYSETFERYVSRGRAAVTATTQAVMTNLRSNASVAEEQASTFRAQFNIFDGACFFIADVAVFVIVVPPGLLPSPLLSRRCIRLR